MGDVDIVLGLQADCPGFQFQQGKYISIVSETSGTTLRPPQISVQGASGSCLEVRGLYRDVELTYSSTARRRMSGVITLLLLYAVMAWKRIIFLFRL